MSFGYAIYFVDRGRNRVVRWEPDTGAAQVIAGGTPSSDPSQALLEPYGLAFDLSGNLLISDKLNHRICRLRNGRLETIPMRDENGHRARRPDSPGLFDPNVLYSPTTMVVEKGGSILCAFYDDHTIYRIHVSGRLELVLGIVPNRPYFHNSPVQAIENDQLSSHPLICPTGLVARSDGTLFFVERQTQVVREYRPGRGMRSIFALSEMARWFQRTEAPPAGKLEEYHPVSPTMLALDAEETLYLCDNLHSSVLRLDLEKGTFKRVHFSPRRPDGFMDGGPVALTFGPDGTAWIANTDTQEIRAYSTSSDGTWAAGRAYLAQVQGEPLRLIGGGMGMVAAS